MTPTGMILSVSASLQSSLPCDCSFVFFSMALIFRYLQRTIQTSDKGHNSAEDAIAALELAQLKVSRGPNFGAERSTDSVFDRLHR